MIIRPCPQKIRVATQLETHPWFNQHGGQGGRGTRPLGRFEQVLDRTRPLNEVFPASPNALLSDYR